MPIAVQVCHGATRLVSVKRFRPDDKADCSYCNWRGKSERKITNGGRALYYVVPTHRPDGFKEPGKIDWGNIQ